MLFLKATSVVEFCNKNFISSNIYCSSRKKLFEIQKNFCSLKSVLFPYFVAVRKHKKFENNFHFFFKYLTKFWFRKKKFGQIYIYKNFQLQKCLYLSLIKDSKNLVKKFIFMFKKLLINRKKHNFFFKFK